MFGRRIFLAFVLSNLVAVASAQTVLFESDWQIPGDAAITTDPTSGLEWLDLARTQNLTVDQVKAELVPGGMFEGFRLATPDEVGTLYSSAGLTAIATAPNTTVSSTDANEIAAAMVLQDLWGVTATVPAILLQRSVAFVDDQPVIGGNVYFLATLDVRPTQYGAATRGSSAGSASMDWGSALVRSTPLPDNVIDFERRGNGQSITGTSVILPANEYQASGITILDSVQPNATDEIAIAATLTPVSQTTISGNVLVARIEPQVFPTFIDVLLANGAREVAFDFALLPGQVRVQAFDDAGFLVFDSIVAGSDNFTFFVPAAGSDVTLLSGHATVNTGQTLSRIRVETGSDGFFLDNLRFEAALPTSANVASDVVLGSRVVIGENVTLESGVSIGPNTIIEDNVLVGKNTSVGADGNIGVGTQVAGDSTIGSDVDIGSGVVIGKNTMIGDNVVVGDLSMIAKDTVIGVDVTVGDNVSIAKETEIGDEVSIGSGTTIEKNVTIGAFATLGTNVSVGKVVSIITGAFVPDDTIVPANSTFP